MKNVILISFLALSASLPAEISPAQATETSEQEVSLIEVPGMTTRQLLSKPKNLARWHMGAVLFDGSEGQLKAFTWRDADGQNAGLLLSDDPTARLDLTPDTYKYVIELNDSYLVNRFTFKNFDAQGSIQVYVGKNLAQSNHAQWKPVGEAVPFSENGYVSSRFDPVETRFVMVTFDITHEGNIGIFGIYGDMSLAEVRMPRTHEDASGMPPMAAAPEDTTKFNFAALTTGSRVTHVSGGDYTMIDSVVDDDVETYYEFPADSTEDVLIIDMAEQREINRVSMLFEAGPGDLNFYLLNDLPEDLRSPSATSASETTSTGDTPGAEDTASYDSAQALGEPLLLLASSPGRLGEWLALSSLMAPSSIQHVSLPQSFFDDTPVAMTFSTEDSGGRVNIDFENIITRYLVVRFVPTPGVPSPHGLRVYEIGMFGDVPEERRRLVRTPIFEFFDAAVDVSPNLNTPTGDSPAGGGGDPRPPPPVSP